MEIKTKEELEKMTVEQLRAYKKELAEHKEKQELLGSIEVKSDPIRDLRDLGEKGRKEGATPEVMKELGEVKARLEQLTKKEKKTFGTAHFEKEITKSLGEDGEEAVAIAKDLSHALPTLDAVSAMTGKKVWELDAFKGYIGVSKEMFVKALRAIERKNRLTALVQKASLDTADSSEWIPTGWASVVEDAIINKKAAVANLPVIDLPQNPYDWPVNNGNNTTYYVTESLTGGAVTVSATNITAGKTTFACKKLANAQSFSEEMNEDAAFAILPAVQRMMIDGLGDGVERCILFGDETTDASSNINLIDATPTTTGGAASLYLACDGAAHKALVDSNGSTKDVNAAGSPSEAVKLVMQQMNEGVDIPQMKLFCPPAFYFELLNDSALKSVANYGQGASILTGEVGRVFGIPVFMTSGIPLTNTAGKVSNTAANNVLASFLLINASKVMIGFKRRVKVAADFVNTQDLHTLVASTRFDFQQFGANVASKNPIGYGYNYPV